MTDRNRTTPQYNATRWISQLVVALPLATLGFVLHAQTDAASMAVPANAPPVSPAMEPTAGASAPQIRLPLSREQEAALNLRHHEADTAALRQQRLHHLDLHLNVDPQTLHATCHFESEISTIAPVKHVALTFDDGPEPGQTEHILDVLNRYQIPATFFMIGEQVRRYPELVRLVQASGRNQIANHSWDHPNFHTITPEEQTQEIAKTEQQLGADLREKYFRYPYGNSSCEGNAYLRASGYKIVGWHIDSCDWAFDKEGKVDPKEAAICGVLPQYRADFTGHVLSALRAHNGGIVLMHEIHPNTLKKLEEIVRAALAEGYVFDTIDNSAFQASMR